MVTIERQQPDAQQRYVINARPAVVLERFRQHRMGEIGVCSVVAAELAYGGS